MSRRRKGEDKTLISYKNVLDSMVNFLGATGALLRQRVETGQIFTEIDCEAECLICASQNGVVCAECSKGPVTSSEIKVGSKECPASKECASLKAGGKTATSKPSTSEVKDGTEEAVGVNEGEKPEENSPVTTTPSDKETSVCVCAQIRTIKDTASKAGVDVSKSQDKQCFCNGRGKNRSKQSCICSSGETQKNELENIIVDRLQTVSKLVDLIQVDLSNLSGKSKSAALYQEIMKERSSLSPPSGDPSRRTELPCGGRQSVRRRLFDTSDINPITAQDVQRRTPTDWSSESRPWFPTPSVPSQSADQYANFVQCLFQRRRQRPGQTFLGNTEPSVLPSQDDRRYREPSDGLVYHSLPVGGSADLNSSCMSRAPCRITADNQQYSQPAPQLSSASRPQVSRVYANTSGPQRNFGSLQRARANFAPTSNLQQYSPIVTSAGRTNAVVQNPRTQFGPASASAVEYAQQNASSNYGQVPQHTSYGLSELSGIGFLDQSFICNSDNCDNEDCDEQ